MSDAITTKPFASTAQQRWAFGTHQPFAKRWAGVTDFSHLPKRVRLRLRKKMRTKAWSEASRAAALIARRRNAAARGQSPSAAAREAAHIRAEGERQARAIRAAGGVNKKPPKPKGGKGGKGGGKKGGGKGGKPKAPPKQKLTPEQRAQERQAAQSKQRAANHDSVKRTLRETDANLSANGLDALASLSGGTEPPKYLSDGLEQMGLAERGGDGVLRLTANGRTAMAAADRGDAKAVIDAVSKAGDVTAARQTRQSAQQERHTAAEQRRQEVAAAREQRKVETAKRQERRQRAQRQRERKRQSEQSRRAAEREQQSAERSRVTTPELADAARALSSGTQIAPDQQQALVRNGLARTNRDGSISLTTLGNRATRQKVTAMETLKAGSPGDYLVVDDPQKSSTWHLQVKRNGKSDHGLMGAAAAALGKGYRGNTYQGPNKDAAISKLRALYRSEKMPYPGEKTDSSFTVFKDAGGRWRWLAVSSSAYRDRDGEIVSTKALENAVGIADATGFRGPLRWWHVGVPFGSGLDLGDCDFQAVHDRFLVESGTFKSEALAQSFKDTSDEVSLGFTHPPDAPDQSKVFGDVPIVIFERSLAPRGRVSNLFTSFTTTKGVDMDDVKTAALKERIGDELLNSLLGNIAATDEKAQDAKIAFKADDPDTVAALVAALKADPSLLETAIKALDVAKKDDGETVAEMAPPPEGDGMDMGEPEGDENMLTAAECQQIADTVAQAVVAQLSPLLNIEQKIQDHAKGISEMIGSTFAQKDAAQAEKDKLIANLKQQQSALDARLKELEGDVPASIKAGFKASESAATVVSPASPLAQSAPQADPLGDFLSGFVLHNGPQPAAH